MTVTNRQITPAEREGALCSHEQSSEASSVISSRESLSVERLLETATTLQKNDQIEAAWRTSELLWKHASSLDAESPIYLRARSLLSATCVRAVQHGLDTDGVAFKRIYDLYKRRIHRICLGICGDEYVRDAMQESFLQIHRLIRKCNDADRFPGWASVVARNKCVDFMRAELDDVTWEPKFMEFEYTDPRPAGVDLVENEELNALVRRGVQLVLSADDYLIVSLYYFEGWTVKAIADELGEGTTVGHVKHRLRHSRERLRSHFSQAVSARV